MAVLTLTGIGLDEATSISVTDALSDELLKTGHVRVMERTQMQKILAEQGFQQSGACDGNECAVEVGRLLSIDRMVVGSIGKLGSAWTLSVRGVNVQTGEILGSARRIQKGEIEDVIPAILPGLADELVAGLLGRKFAPRKLSVPPASTSPATSTTPSEGLQPPHPEPSPAGNPGTLVDPRDGRTYKIVRIGRQTWMAENLNRLAGGSWCYDNLPGNCREYGRLYNWETASHACPAGWHLPSDDEWSLLEEFIEESTAGASDGIGRRLKSSADWNGTDALRFNALPAGQYSSLMKNFANLSEKTCFWSSTEIGEETVMGRCLETASDGITILRGTRSKANSVRCVKD